MLILVSVVIKSWVKKWVKGHMVSSLCCGSGTVNLDLIYLGVVYKAYEMHTNEEVIVKVAMSDAKAVSLRQEYYILTELGHCVGTPKALWLGRKDELHVMILECLGPSLQECLHACGGKFFINMVTLIAHQMVFFNVHTLVQSNDDLASYHISKPSTNVISSTVTSILPTS